MKAEHPAGAKVIRSESDFPPEGTIVYSKFLNEPAVFIRAATKTEAIDRDDILVKPIGRAPLSTVMVALGLELWGVDHGDVAIIGQHVAITDHLVVWEEP